MGKQTLLPLMKHWAEWEPAYLCRRLWRRAT